MGSAVKGKAGRPFAGPFADPGGGRNQEAGIFGSSR